jgi:hypothetical protein
MVVLVDVVAALVAEIPPKGATEVKFFDVTFFAMWGIAWMTTNHLFLLGFFARYQPNPNFKLVEVE